MMKKILYISLIVTIVFILNSRVNAWSKYEIGKEVTYNDISFYVIEDSDENTEIVKLLKENPLTKTEMDNLNLAGITIREQNGYGKVKYGESTDYSTSTVKQVVDAWKNTAVASGDKATARLITIDELTNNLGYERFEVNDYYKPTDNVPDWILPRYDFLWTMSEGSNNRRIWIITSAANSIRDSYFGSDNVGQYGVVNPVLEISKSALGDTNIIDDDTNENEDIDKDDKSNAALNNSNKESKVSVNVPNTMQKVSIILIMVGVLLLSISIFLVIKNKRVIKNK